MTKKLAILSLVCFMGADWSYLAEEAINETEVQQAIYQRNNIVNLKTQYF